MDTARAGRLALAGVLLLAGEAGAQEATPSGATPVSEGRASVRLTLAPRIVRAADAEFPRGETRAAQVTLAITVGVDGNVRDVAVLQSGGARFDAAAVEAARRFVFAPAEVNGRPAAVKIRYVLSFTPAPAPRSLPALVPLPAATETAPPPPGPTPTEEIVVRGAPRRRDVTDVTVSATEASQVAGTQGDPIKIVENLPGLARPSFGSGQLIVWGSAPAETRTYVDGVEIPALFHGSALRSTVNGDLVRDVTLTPGAYGADYGRALGGMVRVETKDLPETGVHGYAAADTLDGSGDAHRCPRRPRPHRSRPRATGGSTACCGRSTPRTWTSSSRSRATRDYQAKMQIMLRPRESLDAVFLGSRDDLARGHSGFGSGARSKRDHEHRLPAALPSLPPSPGRRGEHRRGPFRRARHEHLERDLRSQPSDPRRVDLAVGSSIPPIAPASPRR